MWIGKEQLEIEKASQVAQVGKESIGQHRRCRRHEFDPWVGKIPWRREWQTTTILLPGKIPWTEDPGRLQSLGCKEFDTTEHVSAAERDPNVSNHAILTLQGKHSTLLVTFFQFTYKAFLIALI